MQLLNNILRVLFLFLVFALNTKAQDTVKVEVPNVFTPNKDGVNDVFRPKYANVKRVEGYIYNRWGEVIFQWWGLNGYWDGVTYPAGKEVPSGTYYYIINVYSLSDEKKVETGSVTLLR